MLKLTDLRKTTRRASDGQTRIVHPRLLRDRTLAPRIELAIRYMERMLGHPRSELDPEVIVQLFGDHKVARCVVACLAASYRPRARAFAELLPAERVARLAEQGVADASGLRLWLFRRVNREQPGFVDGAERAPFLRAAGAELGLSVEQIETLMTLDAPANAVLTRFGPAPTAGDVIARFNYETVAALLANAPLIRLSLRRALRSEGEREAIRALCAVAGVRAELSGREFVLHGQQDALNGWTRHGARLVRLLASLLLCGLPARSGEAAVAAPNGGEWRFRLDAETLGYLGATPEAAEAGWRLDALLAAWGRMDDAMAELAALRRTERAGGWALRRATEPVITEGGLAPALFVCVRGAERVPLLLAPAHPAGVERLSALARRQPLVALTADSTDVNDVTTGAGAYLTLRSSQRGALAALPGLLAETLGAVEGRASVERLAALCEEARANGVVTEAQVIERLRCEEDEIAARLAEPAAQATLRERGLQYVEGFGLCSGQVLRRAEAAAADVASLRERTDGAARVVRALGRRLREVTGANEGIECLIAYLGAA